VVVGVIRVVTERATREPDESAPEPGFRSRLAHRLAQWLRHKGWAVLGVGVVLSGVLAVVGVTHLAWPWLFAVGCAITALATLTIRALEARKLKDRVRNLYGALAIACLLPVIAFCYHEWWDPSRAKPGSYQVIVDGGANDVFYPYDEPGGTQGFVYRTIPSQSAISLDCYVSLPTSGVWYRIQYNGGWIPRDGVHAIPGVPFPSPPHC
jgi:MFS family permease